MKLPFKVLGVEHIGLAPKDVKLLRDMLEKTLGLDFGGEELVSSQNTRTFFFDTHEGDTRLELLAAVPEGTGPIASFLEKRGAGIHHIALRVDSLESALSHLKAQKVELIDEKPRLGAHSTQIAFLHPRACGGILIELVERS